jgi:NitT/TauT family transport system ATP-binding protein
MPAAAHDIVLECRNVSHSFRGVSVLHDINLKVARGQFVSLVGSSGVGKSTLLRAILGTHPPESGEILMNGEPVTMPGRDRGIVYQRYSLFPFLTAQQNAAFGLKLEQTPLRRWLFGFWSLYRLRRDQLRQAAELLNRFQLGDKLHHYPSELSGGMCQRVAIAQALIMKPQILLLDEPFGALDEAIREEQQAMLLSLYHDNLQAQQAGKEPPYTVILVTHELNEALKVSDRVVALSRYWHWGDSHQKHPGATIVYDAVAPDFHTELAGKHLDEFLAQRREIRHAAFDPQQCAERGRYVRFWDECQQGKGIGVMRTDANSNGQ